MAIRNISIVLSANIGTFQNSFRQAAATLNNFQRSLNGIAANTSRSTSNINNSAANLNTTVGALNRGMGVGVNQFGRYNAAGTAGGRAMAAMATQTGLAGKAMAGLSSYAMSTISVFGGFLAINTTIRGLSAAFAFVKDSFMDFNKEMTESMAIMGDLSDTMKEDLAEGVKEVSKQTTYSAAEAAEGLYFIASAGFDAAAAIEVLPVAARFAQAGMLDLAKATEYLLDITRAFDLVEMKDGFIDVDPTIENMERVSDVITQGAIDSNASIDQIAAALTNKAAGSARAFGISLEETTAAIETFASVGVKGQIAGTQFAMVTRDLQKVAINSGAALKDLGVQVFDADGEFQNLGQIMIQLEQATAGMSDETKRATYSMLGFQDRSLGALLALSGMGDEMVRFEMALYDAGGATKEVAGKQLESFTNQITLLKNALGVIAIDAVEKFIKGFKLAWQELEPFRKGIEDIIEGILPGLKAGLDVVVGAFKIVAAVMLPVLNGFGVLASAVSKFSGLLPIVGVLMFKNIIGALGTHLPYAARGASGVIMNLGRDFHNLGHTLAGMGQSLGAMPGRMAAFSGSLRGGISGLAGLATAAGQAIMRIPDLGQGLSVLGNGMRSAFQNSTILSGAFSAIGAVTSRVSGAFSGITGAISNFASRSLATLTGGLHSAGGVMARFGDGLVNMGRYMAGMAPAAGRFQRSIAGLVSATVSAFPAMATSALVFFMLWQQNIASAEASAKQFVGTLTQGFDMTTFKGITDGYNGLVDDQSAAVDAMNQEWESYENDVNRAFMQGLDWISPYNNALDETSERTDELNKQMEKYAKIVDGVEKLQGDLSTSTLKLPDGYAEVIDGVTKTELTFEEFDKAVKDSGSTMEDVAKTEGPMQNYAKQMLAIGDSGIQASQEAIFAAGEMAGIDWEAIGEGAVISNDQKILLRDTVTTMKDDLDRLGGGYVTLDSENDEAITNISERSEELRKTMRDVFGKMASSADAYKESLIEVQDAHEILSELVSEETDAFNQAQQDAADAAQSSADATVASIQDGTDAKVDALEADRDRQLEALNAPVTFEDGSTGDMYSDVKKAETKRINDAFDAQVKAIRDGGEASADAAKEAGDVQAKSVDRVEVGAAKFLTRITDTTEEYKTYLGKIDELARAGASVELIDIFRNMKPEEGKVMLEEILSNQGEFIEQYNTALGELGKVENTPSWETFKTQTEERSQDMVQLGINMLKVSRQTGSSYAAVEQVAAEMDEKGIDVAGAFASFGDQIDLGNGREVANLFKQWEYLGAKAVPDATAAFQDTLTLLDTEASGNMENLKSLGRTLNPDAFMRTMLESGLADMYSEEMRTVIIDGFGKTEAEFNGMMLRIRGEIAAGFGEPPPIPLRNTSVVDRIFGGNLGKANNADGSIMKFFARGGIEDHVAQIAPAGTMRVWAEPETGGEAYIPLASSKRMRSLEILGTVAKMFGYGLTQFSAGGFYGGVSTSTPASNGQQIVVVPVNSKPQTIFTGNINGANFDEIRAKAVRIQRQKGLVGG